MQNSLIALGLFSGLVCQTSAIAQEVEYPVAFNEPMPLLEEAMGDFHHPISSENELAQRYFDQGFQLMHGFAKMEAVRSFRASWQAHILEGEIFWSEDNREAALGAFQEAASYYDKLNYDEPEPLPFSPRHWLGALYMEMEAFDNALAEYRQDLSEHPNNIWTLWGVQQALLAQGQSDPEIDEKLEGTFEYADIWLPTTKF